MADQNGTTPAVETAESAARALAVRAKEAREIVAAAARSENDSTSARTKEEFKWNLGYKLADRYEDDEVGAQQYLENIAVRFYVDNVLQPTLNNPEEFHAASLQMYTEPNSGIIDIGRLNALMEINHARCMLDDFDAKSSNRNSTIPLSLWPPIIAKETSPDVIYFLLQNSVTLKNGILRQD